MRQRLRAESSIEVRACQVYVNQRAPPSAQSIAIDELAKHLLAEMERLDPTDDWDPSLDRELNWARLDPHRRTFYRLLIEALLTKEDWVRAALGG